MIPSRCFCYERIHCNIHLSTLFYISVLHFHPASSTPPQQGVLLKPQPNQQGSPFILLLLSSIISSDLHSCMFSGPLQTSTQQGQTKSIPGLSLESQMFTRLTDI